MIYIRIYYLVFAHVNENSFHLQMILTHFADINLFITVPRD
ncbi:hypothetical protein PSECIP111951_03922 [Pseudoalteromonas holothuriae]|uniref:Uncharacterized protein n=1 Tax=Pseudoalteromonas holothuriae TaxID=2963714 RepID=A0A9W4VT01_9GAMM|nr:hypothetical protein PSECIP111854_02900 [Pseudoalteromonas sp. CIP111854]CAH9067865.1 hypothetical protein PSECIP111951_03922 [Pseudoalteromonas sp. CIP111951]